MTHATTGRDVRRPEPAAAAEPGRRARRLAAELRAGRMVWRREMKHFWRDLPRVAASLVQPMLFLYILGIGLARLVAGSNTSDDYLLFLFPGVLVMSIQQPAVAVGSSIVWDRQSGFLREMLVAPVARITLLIGKCLGGATVSTCQALVVLASAGLAGVPYRVDLFAALLAELLLVSLSMTVLAAALAVGVRRVQTFNVVLTALFLPLTFLSGMMFPVSAMPGWMAALSLVDPLTYAVDGMRQTVMAFHHGPTADYFDHVTWGGWQVPAGVSLAVVALTTLVGLLVAGRCFRRTD
ncbi:ABC transporter permease [Streptomyces olivoreticuli]|uniref:ABC transporter permease n=1 Tax=Streptomyces olivoreticuli TaxID=68246 RepID=UPI00265825FF|nr:ABC transporter permease [Streptomyces olivoreticuli]WKK22656.1 ABC transporter permease [Streptomyces olivoreticuli]